ncbi:MAG TPA: DUF1800 family protein [Candidatus Dormibacteraeota bacterium]|nr:DUF1800 family protein [Candidatus Dormibacteraeota bacterium]
MSSATFRLTRRQALATAAVGAAGAAGARLLAGHLGGGSSLLGAVSAAGPSGSWESPLGSSRGLAAHLLRRTGFAASETELDAAASMSYDDLVDHVVSQRPDVPAAPRDTVRYAQVAAWWYGHMATTSAQFPERMTLFWHGLLTSDYRKSAQLPFMYQQNQLFRRLGTGDLRSLLLGVTYDPAMIRYLDLDQSTAKAPNENYSRELMELFTLGAGNYSETDVREGARAFSGIRITAQDASGSQVRYQRQKGMTAQQFQQQLSAMIAQGLTFRGVVMARQHDGGQKTYLGRTGTLGPEEAIDTILAQPACATFLATKALTYFAVPQPSSSLVSSVAGQFRDSHHDLRTLMRAILRSDDFRAASAYRSLVRSPADYLVAAMRSTGMTQLGTACVQAGAGMDQVLFDPPTVGGWPQNASWLSSSSLLARLNFAQALVARGGSLPDAGAAVHTHLDGVVSPDTAAVYNASQTNGDRWYALLSSPEFHLK